MSDHKDQQDQAAPQDQTETPPAANQDRELSDADLAQVAGGFRVQEHGVGNSVTSNKAKTADKAYTQMDGYIKQ